MITTVLTWCKDHWQSILLVESTVMAFIPVKYNGIAQSIWGFISGLVSPKK